MNRFGEWKWMAAAVALALALALPAAAQNIYGTISGTVTDPSGAVIPGAAVVLRNNATGATRTVKTDPQGAYSAPLLPEGTYTVTVRAHGFQTRAVRQVVLNVGQHRALNTTLQPGAVTQTVTVTTSTIPVQTTSPAQAATVTGTQVRQLELNNRNFEQLVTLQPGASSSLPAVVGFGLENTTAVSVDGARSSANNWSVDGADINDSGSNATLLNVPSVDAIAQFTTERGNYSAEYGRSGGAQVNVVTRSGTNRFHGSAYEFLRNNVLQANSFLLNAANVPRPAFHYNDFGFTLGGPVIKNHTFFFVSEEWRRQITPDTQLATLPNPQILTGNFTGLYTSSGTPVTLDAADAPAGCITGNVISPSCISTNANAYVHNLYNRFTPSPASCKNSLGEPTVACFPYTTAAEALNNYRQDLVRLDQYVGQRIQLFGRYMGDSVPTTEPGGLFASEPLPGVSSTSTNAPGRNVVAHAVLTFSPTLLDEAAFNYSWGGINSTPTGIFANASAFSGLNTSAFPYTDPYHRIPGIAFSGISGITGVAIPTSPYFERNIDKNVLDNISWIDGNHSLRAGFTLSWMRKTENAVNPTNADFTFSDTGAPTNAAGAPTPYLPDFANFLLGSAALYNQANRDIIPDLHYLNAELYAQDNWRVSRNLTFDFGLRWSYFPTPTDSTGILDNFDFGLFNPAAAPAITPAGQFPTGVTPGSYTNGIIIGGVNSPYGQRVNPDYGGDVAPRLGFAWDPTGSGKMAVRAGYGVYFDRSLNGIWEQNEFVNPPFVNFASAVNTSFDAPVPVAGAFPVSLHATGSPSFPTAYVQDYSLSVERQLGTDARLQIAYVGSKGTHLLGIIDMNQVPLSALAADTGCVGGGSSTCPEEQAMRPYQGYDAIDSIANYFNSNYNSLQLSYNRHVARGLTAGVVYTWARDLTDSSSDRSNAPYDSYDIGLEYGPANFQRSQVLALSYIYQLPFLRAGHGWVSTAFGGWEVSGITTIESGLPVTVYQFNDPFNCDQIVAAGVACPAGTYPGGIGILPSAVVPRPDVTGLPNDGPQTAEQWFNTSVFTPAVGHFGNAGNGVVYGPGLDDWDIALLKNFRVHENYNLQLRGECFNAWNAPEFNGVANFVGATGFGAVTSVFQPRTVQLGAKFTF
ncbi:MAG: carboxypeptidase regulatory-like domain-containing protein [Terriglobales bacterium]